MIAKALLTALLLSGIYTAALKRVPATWQRWGISSHQSNIVGAERVIFSDVPPENLLVGSSLTVKLDPKVLGPRFGSLAIAGASAQTGLEMIRRSQLKPRRVFIEINLFYRTVDAEVLNYFYSFPMGNLRRRFGVLQQANQPVNLFCSWVRSLKNPTPEVPSPALVELALQDHARHGEALPETIINATLDRLEKEVEYLRGAGVEVIFVQYPEHPRYAALPINITFRSAFRARFPEEKFRWLYPDKLTEYQTMDGIHLDVPSAVTFANELRRAAGISP